eukprot:11203672-Lingulodinium_polyedra.AAC.1
MAKAAAKRRSVTAASYQRKGAHRHLCALDRLLLLLRGWGLSHLSPTSALPVPQRPTLVLRGRVQRRICNGT